MAPHYSMPCRSEKNSLPPFLFLCLVFTAVLGLFPNSAEAQTTTTLVPSSYVTTSGGSGNEPVATSIDLLDESGFNPVSGKYVDFWAASAGAKYAGYRVYTLPSSITPSSITNLQVEVNYQGPNYSTQVWTWQIFNWSTNAYVTIGNNSAVTQSWYEWQILNFTVPGTLANYVRSSDGQMRVQLLSNNTADDTYIDYEAIIVTSGQSGSGSATIHGVTVADDYDIRTSGYLNQVLPALTNLSVTPAVRTVFTLEVDSGSQGGTANTYTSAIQQIKAAKNVNTGQVPIILGQPVDSSYMFCFTQADHKARWNDYVNTLGSYVDIWEIGNEINGNWLYNTGPNADTSGESCPSGWPGGVPSTTIQDVANKMVDAYNIVKGAGKHAALTLTFCPTDLPAPNQPFTWISNYVPSTLLNGMDYVLISYYPDATGCAYGLPKASDWVSWFQQLHTLFPNAKLGMGEWGYTSNNPPSNLSTVLQEGYAINPSASLPAGVWIGGVFYWEFGITAVPRSGNNKLGSPSDWSDVNTDLQNQH
jgi:N-terminal glycosyl-hydrolase-114-associated domain